MAAVIIVRLQGGLGNQMFGYATGRSLAVRLGTDLVLDTSLRMQQGLGTKPLGLDCFDHQARVCPVWDVARVPNPSRLVRTLQRLRPSRRPFVRPLDEDSTTNAFIPAVLTARDGTYLRGYWQFEGYFADREAEVRSDLTFPELGEESKRVAAAIESHQPTVSVHVRRGDYVAHGHLSHLEETYYVHGVRTIAEAAGDLTAFVFSDDPQWCSENLRLPCPTRVVDRPLAPSQGWEDMCLMSLCNHHVIANSTYSWWGAWLDPSPSKLVVAPREWVLSSKRIGDPVPDRWIRM
jgi:hypothetical protein